MIALTLRYEFVLVIVLQRLKPRSFNVSELIFQIRQEIPHHVGVRDVAINHIRLRLRQFPSRLYDSETSITLERVVQYQRPVIVRRYEKPRYVRSAVCGGVFPIYRDAVSEYQILQLIQNLFVLIRIPRSYLSELNRYLIAKENIERSGQSRLVQIIQYVLSPKYRSEHPHKRSLSRSTRTIEKNARDIHVIDIRILLPYSTLQPILRYFISTRQTIQ